MLRSILGVIVGYVVMFVLVFVLFSVAYAAMGTDRAFAPASYETSILWILASIVLGFVAAVAGGVVCALIAKKGKAPAALAVVVIVLGLLLAVPVLMAPEPTEPLVRGSDVGMFEAMQHARQPGWLALLNPFVGAAGVMLGASFLRKK